MSEDEVKLLLKKWRKSEEEYFASIMNAVELYTEGIRLVRGIANDIDVEDENNLPEAYTQMEIPHVTAIAESLELVHRDFLDYNLARDAAFNLRHRDILIAKSNAEIRERLAEARASGKEWVSLYNNEQEWKNKKIFQRLDMHLPDGMGIFSASEFEWEKGWVYVVEPIVLEPATGDPLREVQPPDPRQEFSSSEELAAAVALLREKYSAGDPVPESEDNK
jgi:hypothetical protein